MAYYLKYRPQKLNDLDLTSVRKSLKKIVKSKQIPHAFLFAGPKGTGKTSAARLLAKVANCESDSKTLRGKGKFEPCNRCKQCTSITNGTNIDVIELDAASHRGIDDVRALRDAVKLTSVKANKKVYIIDEAHMLTKEASNALLKTLEEPPEHVMFILATTNPEKLIDTIRSRTTYVSFNKATQDEIVRSLKRVVRGEKIKIDKKALQMIADASDGSFRDAVKILEQLVSEKGKKKLNKESVEEFIAGKSFSSVEKILDHLLGKSAKDALVELDSFVKQGGEVKILIERLIYKLREALLSEVGMGEGGIEGLEKAEIVKLIRLFSRAASELPTAVLDQIPVELAIIEWCEQDDLSKRGNGSGKKSAKSTDRGGTKSSNDIGSTGSASSNGESKSNGESTKPIGDVEIGKDVWNEILSLVKPVNFSTEALLRAARPVNYDGKTLTIGVYYEFHKERLDQLQHRKILEEVVMRVVGTPVRVNCKLVAPERKKVEEKSKEEVVLTESGETSGEGDDILEAAKEIFGS